jgi:hypothetical protein
VRVLTQGEAIVRLIGPRDWTNPIRRLDVNGNTTVEPQDVLVIINEINDPRFSDSTRQLVDAATLTTFPGFYYDTASDGFAVPQDALVVINFLNGGGGEEAEADSAKRNSTMARSHGWVIAQVADRQPASGNVANSQGRTRTPPEAPAASQANRETRQLPSHILRRREAIARQRVFEEGLQHAGDIDEIVTLLARSRSPSVRTLAGFPPSRD